MTNRTGAANDEEHPRRHTKHWAWFGGILAALGTLGVVPGIVLMLPLAMATDACHDDSAEKVCKLSARGQNTLVMIPWMCLITGYAAALVAAGVAARFRWTPLIGILVGIAAYFAMIPVGYEVAFHL